MDYGHEQAEKALKKLEKRLNKEYTQAAKEVEKKLNDHLRKYEAKDHKMADKVKSGEMSEKDYLQWRAGQMAMGDRWKKLRDELVETYQDTNKVATDMIQDHTHQVYADNFNFGTFEVEKGSNVDTSFTLYSKDTVARLVKDNPKLLPPPNNKVSQAIKEGKAKRWNQQKVQSVMTQGILQGESIPKIAKRLSVAVGEMNMHSAIRNARTMTTSAENAGRIDSYKRAQDMGIEVKKQWLATLDGRTRHSHRILDGESVGIDEKFSNGLMFPADPDGAPAEVYNCRCTLIADIAGFSDNIDDLSLRRTGEGFTDYETWKDAHEEATVEQKNNVIDAGEKLNQGIIISQLVENDRSEEFFEAFGNNGVSYLRSDNISHNIESALVQLQERYPMQQRIKREYSANIDNIIVTDYKDAWLHLPKGTDDIRLDNWAVAQVFQNDVNGKNQAVIAFNKGLISENVTIEDVVASRAKSIKEGKIIYDLSQTNATAVAVHEWGHVFTEHMTSAMFYDDPDAKDYWSWYKSLSKDDIEQGISSYATESRGEFEAECFLEMQMPNPRPLAVKWWSYMEKVMAKGY